MRRLCGGQRVREEAWPIDPAATAATELSSLFREEFLIEDEAVAVVD
jgi:hypothetical protein